MTHPTSPLHPEQVPSWRPRLTRWFLKIPGWFEHLLPGVGKWQLFWLVIGLLLLSIPLIVVPLTVTQQIIVSIVLVTIGWLIVWTEQRYSHRETSQNLHVFLAWLSIIATLRYLYYRTSYTLNLDSWVNGFFSIMLYAAELYAIATLLLSYYQTLKLRDRQSVDLSVIPLRDWFSVDIYIPTYNEDVAIVRKTALAALAIDYPDDKKRVYVLDDGRKFPERREKLRRMCRELGCTMLTRDNNDHAKAGNINTAMQRTKGDLILILDCDHIPSRPFLKETVGFFYTPEVALVQTPHWFYNPDPFERNLMTQGHIPVHNELFYKVIQKGNDFWNAAFFCGSAAVVRKAYVQEVGGIAVETVTEDCHTSLRLHSRGYTSIYYDKIMVAGLAPEKFSSYVGQQVRWARGMAQILRLENPLFNSRLKLSLSQRLCYFSATSHFFFGFPRLMYAVAPILFLLFGINLIRGLGVETLAYALPHIVLGLSANYVTQKNVRYSFWNEIFEYALAFHNGIVTSLALINPKLGKFNVTDKGVSVTQRNFDWTSARVAAFVTFLLVLSLLTVPFWLVLQPQVTEAVIINALWSLFNLVLIGAALLVAFEQPQLRRTHRLNRQLTAITHSTNQTRIGQTIDVSESGARILLDSWPNLPDVIDLELVGDFGARVSLTAQVIRVDPFNDHQSMLAVNFIDMSQSQYDALVLVLYSDVAEWYAQDRQEIDKPLDSLRFLATGLLRVFREPKPAHSTRVRKHIQAAVQLCWEGQFYAGVATAMNSRSLRLELDTDFIPNLEWLDYAHSPVGVLISQHRDDPAPVRLVGEVHQIESRMAERHEPSSRLITAVESLTIELVFPEHLDRRQGQRIKQLLRTLE
ncbi:UDP-forming cellulose synthase catalytic subunit [Oculatella sp. LEGE 06141]|uniref:UDP-forming cellulose synthase catalytic subunit n=1 Tax=Oculatella sp. LEGE 06141 TaxID=1828648 RepID=UPI0018821420|nr:UDP-forming cellulose synthase catalytic subunit [Oculatella sp. LEGE 06141]MBE9182395.1 UDP-forming cellulose synthase catalytic subunit [Oculatella sp. LEGE 06141]